jgi:MOSC domain-containing protein YiiM
MLGVLYKVIAQGNIIIGEELEMISRRKSFAIALSREMVPTARLVVYYTAISNGNYFDKHKNKQNAKGATQKMKSSECWEFFIDNIFVKFALHIFIKSSVSL